jgi:F-type H+-transporting ATPase subunit delta
VGKKVVIKPEVDPEIIGGIVARVGGRLLDGSTRSKLAALKREMVGMERKR